MFLLRQIGKENILIKNNLPDVYFKLMNGNKIVKGPTKLEYGKDTFSLEGSSQRKRTD